jgi:hypothetical protein
MNALLLNFVRRWWWVMLGCALISAVSVFSGTPIILPPAGVLLLLIDAQRGHVRVIRCLPISTPDQVRYCWVAAVFLSPVLSALAMFLGAFIRDLLLPTDPYLWFRMGVQVWLALGYSAICYIIVIFLPTRPAESLRENVTGGIAGGLWGLSIGGLGLIYTTLPRTPADIAPWHWVLFALFPAAFAASIVFAGEFLQRRSAPPSAGGERSRKPERKPAPSALSGIPLYLATVPTRAVVLTVMVYAFQFVFLWLFLAGKGGSAAGIAKTGATQTAVMGIMFASMTAMWVGVRALRVLPISSQVLAALLLSPAVGVGLLGAVFAAFTRSAGPIGGGSINSVELGALIIGASTLGLALMIRYPKIGIFLLIAGIATATPIGLLITLKMKWLLQLSLYVGVALTAAGYLLVLRSLRYRSEVYQTPHIFGGSPWQMQGR